MAGSFQGRSDCSREAKNVFQCGHQGAHPRSACLAAEWWWREAFEALLLHLPIPRLLERHAVWIFIFSRRIALWPSTPKARTVGRAADVRDGRPAFPEKPNQPDDSIIKDVRSAGDSMARQRDPLRTKVPC
jgi:hypothetical protein